MTANDPRFFVVAKGLFEGVGDEAHLLGTRCSGCDTHYFPQSLSCRNPRCTEKRLEVTPLSRQGRLYSYTVQHYRPPPLFRCEPWAPHAVGVIELPERLRVMAMLAQIDLAALSIDMPMMLTVVPLYLDEAGHPISTYAFKPTAAARIST